MNFGATIRFNNQGLVIIFLGFTILYFMYSWNQDKKTDTSVVISQVNIGNLLCTAIAAAEAGGREVKVVREKSNSELNEKIKGKTKEGVNDLLTDGDLRSHNVMYSLLTEKFPHVKVIKS